MKTNACNLKKSTAFRANPTVFDKKPSCFVSTFTANRAQVQTTSSIFTSPVLKIQTKEKPFSTKRKKTHIFNTEIKTKEPNRRSKHKENNKLRHDAQKANTKQLDNTEVIS